MEPTTHTDNPDQRDDITAMLAMNLTRTTSTGADAPAAPLPPPEDPHAEEPLATAPMLTTAQDTSLAASEQPGHQAPPDDGSPKDPDSEESIRDKTHDAPYDPTSPEVHIVPPDAIKRPTGRLATQSPMPPALFEELRRDVAQRGSSRYPLTVCRKTGEIVAGDNTYQALVQEGLPIRVVFKDFATVEEALRASLADNVTGIGRDRNDWVKMELGIPLYELLLSQAPEKKKQGGGKRRSKKGDLADKRPQGQRQPESAQVVAELVKLKGGAKRYRKLYNLRKDLDGRPDLLEQLRTGELLPKDALKEAGLSTPLCAGLDRESAENHSVDSHLWVFHRQSLDTRHGHLSAERA